MRPLAILIAWCACLGGLLAQDEALTAEQVLGGINRLAIANQDGRIESLRAAVARFLAGKRCAFASTVLSCDAAEASMLLRIGPPVTAKLDGDRLSLQWGMRFRVEGDAAATPIPATAKATIACALALGDARGAVAGDATARGTPLWTIRDDRLGEIGSVVARTFEVRVDGTTFAGLPPAP